MKAFIDEKFMLNSDLAVKLYEHIKNNPIIDFHSHLSAREIYENTRYKNISEAWLYHDHYKWRQMRTAGFEEEVITGNGDDFEKFKAFATTLEYAIGNPLYHWSHLELKRYFDNDMILAESSARVIYDDVNEKIQNGKVDVRRILEQSNVKFIATTDDICDELEYHKKIKADSTFDSEIVPTFRPDRFFKFNDDSYLDYIKELESITNPISSLTEFIEALFKRIDYFELVGGRISDHGLTFFKFSSCDELQAENIFKKALKGQKLNITEYTKLTSYLLILLAKEYNERNWIMQLHIGATRDNNSELEIKVGNDAGCDAISDETFVVDLSNFFKELSKTQSIGKVIVYNLNPRDNYAVCSMIGAFQKGPERGRIQFGSGWWFNDQKDGIIAQLKTHSQLGLLRVFIGMLTDSRSFLSMTRHEYFRRILCNYIAEIVNRGEYPNDIEMLYNIVDEISYLNAKAYFKVK